MALAPQHLSPGAATAELPLLGKQQTSDVLNRGFDAQQPWVSERRTSSPQHS